MAAIRIPVNDLPTWRNDEMRLGAWIGTFPFPIVGTVIGGAIGGMMGKSRMERELKEGREVRTPTMLNKKAAIGFFTGSFKGALVGIVLGAAAMGLGMLTVASAPVAAAIGITIVGLNTAAWVMPWVGSVVGALRGGQRGKAEMQRDWNVAEQMVSHRAVARSAQREPLIALPPQLENAKSRVQDVLDRRAAEYALTR